MMYIRRELNKNCKPITFVLLHWKNKCFKSPIWELCWQLITVYIVEMYLAQKFSDDKRTLSVYTKLKRWKLSTSGPTILCLLQLPFVFNYPQSRLFLLSRTEILLFNLSTGSNKPWRVSLNRINTGKQTQSYHFISSKCSGNLNKPCP